MVYNEGKEERGREGFSERRRLLAMMVMAKSRTGTCLQGEGRVIPRVRVQTSILGLNIK